MKKKYFLFICKCFLALIIFQKINYAQTHILSFRYEPVSATLEDRFTTHDLFFLIGAGLSYSYNIDSHWGVSLRTGYISSSNERYFGGVQYGAYLKYTWQHGLYLLAGYNVNNNSDADHSNYVTVYKKKYPFLVIGAGYRTGNFEFEIQYHHPLIKEIANLFISAPTIEESNVSIYIQSLIKYSIAYCIEL